MGICSCYLISKHVQGISKKTNSDAMLNEKCFDLYTCERSIKERKVNF